MNIGLDFEKLTEKAVIVTEQYSRTPNFVIDDMYMAQLSDKAFKCYMLILRQTVGFNRSKTSIATDTFKKYCGIKRDETVYARIRELEQLKLISVTRTTGTTNQITILPNPSQTTVVLTNDTGTVEPHGGSTVEPHGGSTVEPHGGSTVEPYPIKENIKENIKESANAKNSPDEILNLWTPDLHSLNSWLQRSGLPKITQDQAEEILLEINPHYENKIITGAVGDAQMYSNFVKWVKRDSGLTEKLMQQANPQNQSIDTQNLQADMGDW
ncbi:replication protein [Acinetobacter sp. FDAARGOS_724]|uniref:replication protein n=1 Tax=Acinetobacter sp. FDAARGOS_724 TaxID=2545797 RepID=UPI00158D1512|nr:replication protein [Acinetobacter sp. FDAARGOS_724]QKW83415.1 replication protein [Acinetobacter sp. FDAARGOS_724]